FITSTLQQEASRHYGFSASRTMSIAQSLYEGVDMKALGSEGLITYMRTDSIRSAPEAIDAARKLISSTYGKEYLPDSAKHYVSKKNTQDAHEAIRPNDVLLTPDKVQDFLTLDQNKLYGLVYKRFVSSQMVPAIYDTLTCDIVTRDNLVLRTTGSIILFKGFLAVYEEKTDDDSETESKASEIGAKLPDLEEGQKLLLEQAHSDQSFTKPPPRFTEASLIKELEKQGIGRPSTYTSIMGKIQSRAYTTKERLTIKPTELGKIIAQMLESHFSIIMDIAFTANMERDLDSIAENKKDWKAFLATFWKQFDPVIQKAEKEAFVPKIATDIDCPKCGKKLQKIWSKNKYFYGCSNYPDCSFTVPIEALEFKKEDYADKFNWDQICPKCTAPMTIRFGRYGAFLGCSQYPDCNGIINIPKQGEKLAEDMPQCPAIGCDGRLVQRMSRWGKAFFSCSNYPDCNVIANSPEQVMDKYVNYPKTAYVKKVKKSAVKTAKGKKKVTKKKSTKKAAPRNMPKYKVSKELADVIGPDPIERTTATKKLWDYIKANNLQNPEKKREIVPDTKLAKVFGSKEGIDMMKLAGILTKHLEK
ncbi:DNA topoisomerase 1, partial [Candidatus Aerophobetes bacterium]